MDSKRILERFLLVRKERKEEWCFGVSKNYVLNFIDEVLLSLDDESIEDIVKDFERRQRNQISIISAELGMDIDSNYTKEATVKLVAMSEVLQALRLFV